jgi:hypothetical protein
MAHAVAARFTRHHLKLARDSPGQYFAQIKITADTFAAGAIKIKQRFGMLEIKSVPHSAVPGKTRGVEVVQVNTQSLQFRKLPREAAGVVDALVLQEAIFRVWVHLSRAHYRLE